MKKESEVTGQLIPHYRKRHVVLIPVTPEELEVIGSSSAQATLFLTLFGAAIGALVTVLTVLATVEMQNWYVSRGFWMAAFLLGFASIYLCIEGRRAWNKHNELIKTIKRQCGVTSSCSYKNSEGAGFPFEVKAMEDGDNSGRHSARSQNQPSAGSTFSHLQNNTR